MEDANDSIKIMPEGFNQFDLNFKIIIVGDSGNSYVLNLNYFVKFKRSKIFSSIFKFLLHSKFIDMNVVYFF